MTGPWMADHLVERVAMQKVVANLECCLAHQQIVRHHNPLRAIHFGELFEAALSSFKRYVRKMVLNITNLEYNQMEGEVNTIID